MKLRLMLPITLALLAGCNDDSDSPTTQTPDPVTPVPTGEGFPSFYALTQQVLPAGLEVALGMQRNGVREPFPSEYTTEEEEFVRAFSTSENYIGQVLNDVGPEGPVKSMYVLLAQADNVMETINTRLTDEDGNPVECNAIDGNTVITTPFFDGAATPAFNAWDDASKYACYVDDEGTRLLFGRQLIEGAASDCNDPYEYYVMNGSSVDDEPNSEQVDERGPTRDIASLQKFYYNGCTRDLRLMFAQSTLYSAGVEFSSRSEITGNVAAHTFSVRSQYIDAASGYAQHVTLVGTGTSRLEADATDQAAHFVMGYRDDNCGNSADSSTCTYGTARTFCVKNEGAGNDYAPESDASQCAGLLTDYEAILPLYRNDLPAGYFDTSSAAFGL